MMSTHRAMITAALLLPLSLSAFNSAKWLSKRQAMTKDAERLRLAYSNAVALVTSPSEGLTIPLETYDDGSVRTLIFAKRAQIFSKSTLIWADGLVLTKFDSDGTEKLRLDAGACVIDRKSKTGWVEGHAKLTQGKTVFDGDRVYFSSSNNYVTAYANSDIKSADLKFGGVK